MEKIKTSFIATVYNEEKSIQDFIFSLLSQTKLPDEIVIVDASSTDSTCKILKNMLASYKRKSKIIIKKGNRSKGRNEAIKHATGDIIVCSDAGCTLDRQWFEKITQPFTNNDVDVVAGFYLPQTHTIFEKTLAVYTCVMPDRIDKENFLPSSRSIALRKSAWKEVGGYPEDLNTCEDLVFAKKLKNTGLCFVTREDAIVYWPQKQNIVQAFFQFFNYAIGDGMAHFFRPKTSLLFLRYAFALFLFILLIVTKNTVLFYVLSTAFIFYMLWSVLKNYTYIQDLQGVLWLPILQLTADIAVLSGTTYGYIKSFHR